MGLCTDVSINPSFFLTTNLTEGSLGGGCWIYTSCDIYRRSNIQSLLPTITADRFRVTGYSDMHVSACSPCACMISLWASTVQNPEPFRCDGDCAELNSATSPTYNFKFQHYVPQHVDARKLIFAAVFSRLFNHLLFMLCFYISTHFISLLYFP